MRRWSTPGALEPNVLPAIAHKLANAWFPSTDTASSGHVEETGRAIRRAKQEPATRIVPSKRANCPPALGGCAHQNLGAIGDPAKQQKPVLIALRHDKRFWVKRDAGDFDASHAAFERGFVAGPVLILEWPHNRGIGARRRQPMAIAGPGQRARFRRIATHAHVLFVGEAPGMQRVVLHGRREKTHVGGRRYRKMRAFPFE